MKFIYVAVVLTFIVIILNEVNGFLQRLGLFIHMFGFIVGIFSFTLSIYIGFTTTISGLDPLLMAFTGTITFFAFTGLGWVVRYSLIGKCNFFPYK